MIKESNDRRFSFWQLSFGLQLILILTLIGSCGSAGSSTQTNSNVGNVSGDISSLRRDVNRLSNEVHHLRRAVRRANANP